MHEIRGLVAQGLYQVGLIAGFIQTRDCGDYFRILEVATTGWALVPYRPSNRNLII